jgi:hypothetical protein
MKTKTRKVSTVHFTVEDDFITKMARGFWAEGLYGHALNFLSSMHGISTRQMHDVIMGRKRFQEVDETQTFILVADNWQPELSSCHFGQYPDPANLVEMSLAEDALYRDARRKEFSRQLCILMDDIDENPRALRMLQKFMTDQSVGEAGFEVTDAFGSGEGLPPLEIYPTP